MSEEPRVQLVRGPLPRIPARQSRNTYYLSLNLGFPVYFSMTTGGTAPCFYSDHSCNSFHSVAAPGVWALRGSCQTASPVLCSAGCLARSPKPPEILAGVCRTSPAYLCQVRGEGSWGSKANGESYHAGKMRGHVVNTIKKESLSVFVQARQLERTVMSRTCMHCALTSALSAPCTLRAECVPSGPDLRGARLVGGAHPFLHLPPLLSH